MDSETIKAMLAGGATPRAITRAARSAHHDRIDREIAEGKWRCPLCRAPMVRARGTAVLHCPADHGARAS